MDLWTAPNSDYPPPKTGEPPLHRAARLGDESQIRALVQHGADLNATFDIGLDPGAQPYPATPLMVAAGSGDGASAPTVKLLIDLGAEPTLVVGSETAASFACTGLGWNYRPGGDAERLQLLLDAGSSLPQDPEVANRLFCDTAGTGDIARLKVLLRHGLSPAGYWNQESAIAKDRELSEWQDDYRSDFLADLSPELREIIGRSMEERSPVEFERRTSAPMSFEIPLFCAAESGSVECVSLLLDAGADLQARDNSDRTALYYAGSPAVVQKLVAAGSRLDEGDTYGWSPLVAAINDGEEALPRIRGLIEAGADVNGTHDHGYTVFMSAVGSERHPEVLRLLVAAGADPHAISELGYNAFHAAIDVNGEANEEASVRDTFGYLKELGVDIEHRNGSDMTPLARALQSGTGTEVRVLCDLGADPNAMGPLHQCGGEECSRVDRPLLFLAANGTGVHSDEKTEALLRAGADPLAKDANGFTPIEHVVSALAQESRKYEATYQSFFRGLDGLQAKSKTIASTREEFVASLAPALQKYTEQFAAKIPITEKSSYAEENRTERIACIVSLCAYRAWVRRDEPYWWRP